MTTLLPIPERRRAVGNRGALVLGHDRQLVALLLVTPRREIYFRRGALAFVAARQRRWRRGPPGASRPPPRRSDGRGPPVAHPRRLPATPSRRTPALGLAQRASGQHDIRHRARSALVQPHTRLGGDSDGRAPYRARRSDGADPTGAPRRRSTTLPSWLRHGLVGSRRSAPRAGDVRQPTAASSRSTRTSTPARWSDPTRRADPNSPRTSRGGSEAPLTALHEDVLA